MKHIITYCIIIHAADSIIQYFIVLQGLLACGDCILPKSTCLYLHLIFRFLCSLWLPCTESSCMEGFFRATDGCLLPPSEMNNSFTHQYIEVSLKVCKHLCLQVHADTCSLLQYSGKHRMCILTQNRVVPSHGGNCEKVIRMRRTRCPGERVKTCHE